MRRREPIKPMDMVLYHGQIGRVIGLNAEHVEIDFTGYEAVNAANFPFNSLVVPLGKVRDHQCAWEKYPLKGAEWMRCDRKYNSDWHPRYPKYQSNIWKD